MAAIPAFAFISPLRCEDTGSIGAESNPMKYSLDIAAFTIPEIGAASAIHLMDDRLFLVSDNGSYLFVYNVRTNHLEKIVIFESEIQGQIPKHLKADFEAMAFYDNQL
ncbi:MAG TPA: hypothetical protein VGB43_08130, partial [Flavobacterium sp.]